VNISQYQIPSDTPEWQDLKDLVDYTQDADELDDLLMYLRDVRGLTAEQAHELRVSSDTDSTLWAELAADKSLNHIYLIAVRVRRLL
jgi:hypothetical protein